jgi:ABC-type sugar transport system ATPase subunit
VFEQPANRFVAGFIGLPSMNMLEGRIESGRFVSRQGLRISLAAGAFCADEGEPVALGLRPTDLSIGPVREGEVAIVGEASRIEYGGADIFVDLTLSGSDGVRMRVAPENAIRSGEKIEARIRMRALHLFAADGRSLRVPTGG